MAKYSIEDTTLKGIADAIRAKEESTGAIPVPNMAARILDIQAGGTDTSSDTVTPEALVEGYTAHDASGSQITGTNPYDKTETDTTVSTQAGLIAQIQTALEGKAAGGGGSGGSVSWKEVNFVDYDGTLLHSYSVAEAKALPELPPLPSREGLICQGWNYDLETIKSYDTPVTVGATYITDDGKTRIYIHLEEGRTSPMLGCCPNGTVTVDWGDGTATDTLTGTSVTSVKWTPNHNYASAGDYVITLTVDGTVGFQGVSTPNAYSNILRNSDGSNSLNNHYRNTVNRIEMGDGVTSIGGYAFSNCYALASVVIPSGVKSIGSNAFGYCYALTSVVLPSGVKSIGSNAFGYCYTLTSVVLPSGVTSIGMYAFSNCYALASAVLPSGVTSLGSNAFGYCYALTSAVIPSGVASISGNAFIDCYALASVVIPSSVTAIASGFYNCYALTSVVIPSSVTTVGAYAFRECCGVKFYDFSSHTSVPALSATSAFDGIQSDCEIRVPAALYDEWIAATNWSTYASKIVAV